ncbi:MAG TPA: hypothetical protein PLB81_05175 [Deltaproteobacteria bacterium]|nr:hypothetical protein [Deltaproteobacteria bacterium]
MKRSIQWCISMLTAGLLLIGFVGAAWAGADGLYTATTDDGVTLKMLRYRPSTDAPFRTGGQPVLLFPGILTSMNQYLAHTPAGREDNYRDLALPIPLEDWAKDDPYIQMDHMRYYSLAHYLWLKGYDAWFCNYRGTGHGEFKSEKGDDPYNLTTLDVWGIMDTGPCIDKVRAVTGKDPFIGGHSTGGFVCYAYLQGAYFDPAELKAGFKAGYLPHVKSDPLLAAVRNAQIKGFIAIDPGIQPAIPQWADFDLMWMIVGLPIYLDFDALITNLVNPLVPDDLITFALDAIFGTVNTLAREDVEPYVTPYLNFWDMSNTDPNIADFYGRSCATSTTMRCISGWVDRGVNQCAREHWKNGIENKDKLGGEPRASNDGYYYYEDYMYLMRVPTIAVLNATDAMVNAENVIEKIFDAKTKHPGDVYYVIPGTAHADIPLGLNAPSDVFPKIGDWLDQQCATTASGAAPEDYSTEGSSSRAAGGGSGPDDSSDGMCFITSASCR